MVTLPARVAATEPTALLVLLLELPVYSTVTVIYFPKSALMRLYVGLVAPVIFVFTLPEASPRFH